MEEVTAGFLSSMIRKTQERIENHFFEARKHVLEYDDVLNAQREHIYGLRREILLGKPVRDDLRAFVVEIIPEMVENAWMIEESGERVYDFHVLYEDLSEIFPIIDYATVADLEAYGQPGPNLVGFLQETILKAYDQKIDETGEDTMAELERYVMLRAVNDRWMDHLQTIEYIREGIGLRGYGQVDPLVAFKKETYSAFQETLKAIRDQASKMIFQLRVAQPLPRMNVDQEPQMNMINMENLPPELQEQQGSPTAPAAAVTSGTATITPVAATVNLDKVDWKKVGRNDPCPCGSGKKFKACHYAEMRQKGVI